jgi:glutamate dehydrogenase/leucine dehydrogenase
MRTVSRRSHPKKLLGLDREVLIPAALGATIDSTNAGQRAYREVEERAHPGRVPRRVAAYELGIERVIEAGRPRGRRGYT